MLYTPSTTQPEDTLQLSLKDSTQPQKSLRSSSWRKLACPINEFSIYQPIPSILTEFGEFILRRISTSSQGGLTPGIDSVIASNLSYYTLVNIGQVRIKWVEAISLHLEYDERTSVLKLFRYPSFCAMLCMRRDSNSTIFTPLFSQSFGASDDHDMASSNSDCTRKDDSHSPYSSDYFGEILCSYRLIFGQHKAAIQQFRKQKTFARNNNHFSDPLLERLCCAPASQESLYDEIDAPQVKNMYSLEEDFPFLGKRLLRLHEHIEAVNPSDLRTLWYNRRDILRFYTFWAVFVVGGLSIFLAVVQIVLAGVQIYLG